MKRARSLSAEEDQDAQTKAKTRNTSLAPGHNDTCFFFVKLLNGISITAGKCRATERLSDLSHQVQHGAVLCEVPFSSA
jgi:hypothetical protein